MAGIDAEMDGSAQEGAGDVTEPGKTPGFMCVLPWINLHVATSGAISPCCEFKGEVANLKASTLEEAWQSPQLDEVRRAFRDGVRLEACRKCIDREASEGSSLRLQSNRRFDGALRQIAAAGDAPAFPTALDLRFSNLCNFRCRSCWHGASSRWFADAKALGKAIGDKAEISSFETVDEFMGQVEPGLLQLKHIYFAGGEPLMQPEHYALLERLIALGRTDLSLAYNTNMSVLSHKDRSILDLWSQFPSVEVEASVDAAGELGAIIRKGFDWTVFAANVNAVRERCPHVSIRFGITVSVMNIRALPDLFAALMRDCGA
ncbi:MAG: twitch domain-containing radical SAM protein, partial [Aestuariivirga sp.]|nr:twitch domain-containing radical SAM protein [Aestuariivirga sp.]